jgi:Toastrack DUF4097
LRVLQLMKPYFKSIITALIIAGLVLTLTIGGLAPHLPRVAGRADISERRVFSWPGAERLVLDNPDGYIIVQTYDGDTISAQADIKAFFVDPEKGATAAESYVASLVEAETRDGALQVRTEPGERPDGLELLVFYTIKVPVGTNLEIASANGNVWVKEGCGSVNVRGSNADIQIENPLGAVVADSLNGRIKVRGAPEGCQVRTVNGSVFVEVRGGSLKADTINGRIYAWLLDAAVEGCELTSQNGTIKLMVNDECSAQVEARTKRGTVNVNSDFPVDTSAGVRQSRYIKGTIGKGRGRLTMDTLNGDIVIARTRT